MNKNIYKLVEDHVNNLFETHKKPKLIFHRLEHTQEIVKRVEEIAAHYKLSEKEMMAVYVAAWFHDTGHLLTTPEYHEEKSVELMRSFMETKDFKKTNKQVRKELAMDNDISKIEYDMKTLEFLENHKYYTSYCIELLNKGKEENIERLKNKVAENIVKSDEGKLFGGEKESDAKMDKQTTTLISKGIQTMLRLASGNHLRLSEMADRKANILISVNAIIISVSISVLFRKFETDPFLVIPT